MANIAKCNCKNCNNIGTHPIPLFKRGGRQAFLCDYHYSHNEGYYTKNNSKQGTTKAHGFTYGVEFETSKSTPKARIEFTDIGYLPTHDATVNCEYKSPIMNGLNQLAKHTVTFERLINENDLEVNNECGTHLHIGGSALNLENMQYIKRFYHSLFVPLSDKLANNPEATKALFGRSLNYWASPIHQGCSVEAHTNFINMQHDHTIEFRACKFVNAKQYMNAVHFCDEVVKTVLNNFVEHFNDEPKDKRRYATQTAYRKHKAQMTAKKLVKLFEKYSNI